MALWILRGFFLLAAAGVGYALFDSSALEEASGSVGWMTFVFILLGAVGVIIADIFIPRKRIDTISCVYFGIAIGLFLTFVVGSVLDPLLQGASAVENKFQQPVQLVLGVFLCYSCVSLLLQTKDDFRFIIPYVEFAKEVKGVKPYLLDTSVVIDGRIADVVETGVLDNQLVMPRFVLAELQGIADSGDKLRRARGRRGLDILDRLRNDEHTDLKIYDREHPDMAGQPVDMKLILLAKHMDGKVVTGDYNLNKVAKLHNVEVINLNDIANSLKPVFLPGEEIKVKIVKIGEGQGQGIGYLDDGTMIVVEGGRDFLNQTVDISVTSVLQTSAGRMIFGRNDSGNAVEADKTQA